MSKDQQSKKTTDEVPPKDKLEAEARQQEEKHFDHDKGGHNKQKPSGQEKFSSVRNAKWIYWYWGGEMKLNLLKIFTFIFF